MDPTREAAKELMASGVIEICQKGQAVEDVDGIKGPIRLRLKAAETSADEARQ